MSKCDNVNYNYTNINNLVNNYSFYFICISKHTLISILYMKYVFHIVINIYIK